MKNSLLYFLTAVACCLIVGFSTLDLDLELKQLVKTKGLDVVSAKPTLNPDKVELGRMLFFDKLLSGNKDLSCATCHHPAFGSADGLSLSIGVGGKGLGSIRQRGYDRELIPRNAPDVFNRGSEEWHTMFWDNRVSGSVEEGFDTPADEKLPDGLENILAVQAMFPVTSRDEMRGEIGDKDVFGQTNELALISPASPQAIWHRIMLRVLKYPQYREMFQKVYPDVKLEDLGFQHAANAIAAFEISAFTFNDSPWDQYITGNTEALSEEAKRGALLFFGKANCAECHSGPLMTDQKTHNIGVPQLGPGKGNASPLDVGRYLETGDKSDIFAFRTPPLKNVALTAPWMHNGAFSNLEAVVRHHLNPQESLLNFQCTTLPGELAESCQIHVGTNVNQRILDSLDPKLTPASAINETEVQELVSFLKALTDASALKLDQMIPKQVPSGLPVVDE